MLFNLIRNCAEVVGHTIERKLVSETTRVNRKEIKTQNTKTYFKVKFQYLAIIKKGALFFLHFFQDLPAPGTNLGSALIQPVKAVG